MLYVLNQHRIVFCLIHERERERKREREREREANRTLSEIFTTFIRLLLMPDTVIELN